MRKSFCFLIGTLLIGSFLAFLEIQKAQAQETYFPKEKIENFQSIIDINRDNSLNVQETILYDFGNSQRHGIFRVIPLKGIKIKTEKVLDQFGHPYRFTVSKKEGNLKIKIGNPQVLISGEHTYIIFYKVWRGLRYFQDHDELYWNVTGNKWDVPILQSKAIIHFPQKIPKKNLKMACYTGIYGAKSQDCSFQINNKGGIVFRGERNFSPREGMTIALSFPKNIVKEPSAWQKFLWKYGKFWSVLIPFFAFIFLFEEWWRKGRDPKIKKPIIVRYQPPEGLRPAQVGLIMRQKVDSVDISATLIDLAVRGYIKIKEMKKSHLLGGFLGGKDYEIIWISSAPENPHDYQKNLLSYENQLLELIFGQKDKVFLSRLRGKFPSKLKSLRNGIYESIASAHYFTGKSPEAAKEPWVTIGLLTIIFAGLAMTYAHSDASFCLFLSLAASGILFMIFGRFMPKKTKKGAEIYQEILGFKEYMNTAEKYRAQFYEKENIFEKYLPYAIVFGLTKKWAKAFEGIYKESPSWYEGSFGTQFTTLAFVDSMNQSLNSFNGVFTSSSGGGVSGLGGGGFSGGGSGGGGGGSW